MDDGMSNDLGVFLQNTLGLSKEGGSVICRDQDEVGA